MPDNLGFIFDLMTTFGGIILVIIYWMSARRKNTEKSMTVALLIIFLIIDINFGKVFDGLGIYVFRIMSDFALVLLISLRACRETAIIMMLALFSIVINVCGFSYETLNGIQDSTDIIINFSIMGIFYSMLAVLLHKGLTDGIYSFINNLSIVRCYCRDHLKIDIARVKK